MFILPGGEALGGLVLYHFDGGAFDVEVDGPSVKVIYTLTSMGCPAGQMIEEDIDRVVGELAGVDEVKPELTFEPPWSPERMSEDAKFILGFG
jgi:metal-sulfur cluster biosynthetic enzyme